MPRKSKPQRKPPHGRSHTTRPATQSATRAATRAATRGASQAATPSKRWSQQVMRTSDALDLEPGVFTLRSPRQIALSLQRSALASKRRKASPYASAMSMLTFHMNRSGQHLSAERKRTLGAAKEELRRVFGRA